MVNHIVLPFVYTNWTEERIRQVFVELGWGEIAQIDIKPRVPRPGQPPHNMVFVHFATDICESQANAMLEAGQEVKIVYDEPWFWKARKYFKVSERTGRQGRGAYVDFTFKPEMAKVPVTHAPPMTMPVNIRFVPASASAPSTNRRYEGACVYEPIWSDVGGRIMQKWGWEGRGLGASQQGRLAPVALGKGGQSGLGFNKQESSYDPVMAVSASVSDFSKKLAEVEPLIDLSEPAPTTLAKDLADLLA